MSDLFFYGYFVSADGGNDRSLQLLHAAQLDEAWVRLTSTELQLEGRALLQLELFDLESGQPLAADTLGPQLSADGHVALLLGFDEEEARGALSLYRDGELAQTWESGAEGEDEGAGFERELERLTGIEWREVRAGIARHASDIADEGTILLLRGRLLQMPSGCAREPDLFRFHYGGPEEGEEEPSDQMALVLLDLALVQQLWSEAPAAVVKAFLEAIEPSRAEVLGPMGHALRGALALVEEQPEERPLAAGGQQLVIFELLAMASSLGFFAGCSIEYLDERFFPLLSLDLAAPVNPAAIEASLEEIEEMGALSAIAEVTPYSVPEGELLECFGDDEIGPLADWALVDGAYEGSLFLLDATRLGELVQRFDLERFDERIAQFTRAWYELGPDRHRLSYDSWLAERSDIDEEERTRFEVLLAELRQLLAIQRANELQPALFFFGG